MLKATALAELRGLSAATIAACAECGARRPTALAGIFTALTKEPPHNSAIGREAAELEAGTYWVEPVQLYAFLLATVPRCAASSLLRFLSNDLLMMIAKAAPRRARLIFTHNADDAADRHMLEGGRVYACSGNVEELAPTISLPAMHCIEYLVLDIDDFWCGSTLVIQPGDLTLEFGLGVDDDYVVWLSKGNSHRHVLTWVWSNSICPSAPPQPCQCVFGQCSRAKIGLLFDLVRGTMRWVLNGEAGPRQTLGAGWEQGVRVGFAGEWPDEGVRVGPAELSWQARIIQPSCVPPFVHTADECREALCEGCAKCDEGM